MTDREVEIQLRIDDGMKLLEGIARAVRRKNADVIEHDEAISIGYEGLVAAARTYDVSYGTQWLKWAFLQIYRFVMKQVGKEIAHRQRAREGAAQAVTLLDDPGSIMDDEATHRRTLMGYFDALTATMVLRCLGSESLRGAVANDIDDRLDLRRLLEKLDGAMAQLSPDDAALLRGHYVDDRKLKDMAVELGVSYATIKRRHNTALRLLGQHLRAA